MEAGLIAATVQETDLAGHNEDARAYAALLLKIDAFAERMMQEMRDGDLFIVTGDHGNDPTVGHSQHTREYTPLIVFRKGAEAAGIRRLGVRETLGDAAATLNHYFSIPVPENGRSVFA